MQDNISQLISRIQNTINHGKKTVSNPEIWQSIEDTILLLEEYKHDESGRFISAVNQAIKSLLAKPEFHSSGFFNRVFGGQTPLTPVGKKLQALCMDPIFAQPPSKYEQIQNYLTKKFEEIYHIIDENDQKTSEELRSLKSLTSWKEFLSGWQDLIAKKNKKWQELASVGKLRNLIFNINQYIIWNYAPLAKSFPTEINPTGKAHPKISSLFDQIKRQSRYIETLNSKLVKIKATLNKGEETLSASILEATMLNHSLLETSIRNCSTKDIVMTVMNLLTPPEGSPPETSAHMVSPVIAHLIKDILSAAQGGKIKTQEELRYCGELILELLTQNLIKVWEYQHKKLLKKVPLPTFHHLNHPLISPMTKIMPFDTQKINLKNMVMAIKNICFSILPENHLRVKSDHDLLIFLGNFESILEPSDKQEETLLKIDSAEHIERLQSELEKLKHDVKQVQQLLEAHVSIPGNVGKTVDNLLCAAFNQAAGDQTIKSDLEKSLQILIPHLITCADLDQKTKICASELMAEVQSCYSTNQLLAEMLKGVRYQQQVQSDDWANTSVALGQLTFCADDSTSPNPLGTPFEQKFHKELGKVLKKASRMPQLCWLLRELFAHPPQDETAKLQAEDCLVDLLLEITLILCAKTIPDLMRDLIQAIEKTVHPRKNHPLDIENTISHITAVSACKEAQEAKIPKKDLLKLVKHFYLMLEFAKEASKEARAADTTFKGYDFEYISDNHPISIILKTLLSGEVPSLEPTATFTQ